MKDVKVKGPKVQEVVELFHLEHDPVLAELLVNWFKARKMWLRNRDGKAECKGMSNTIGALDDHMINDSARKTELMNQMIDLFT